MDKSFSDYFISSTKFPETFFKKIRYHFLEWKLESRARTYLILWNEKFTRISFLRKGKKSHKCVKEIV